MTNPIPLVELSPQPPRTDFTDRELTQIFGSLISGLAVMVDDYSAVRRAIQWWAANDEAWLMVEASARAIKKVAGQVPA